MLAILVLATVIALSPCAAWAGSTSFEINAGFSSLHVSAGSTFNADGGIGLEIHPQINFEFNSLNSAIDVFYQGRLGSNIGAFPTSRVGTGIYYYPLGLPLQTTVLDNGVSLSHNHFAPFLVGNFAFTTVAITASNLTPPLSFNGLTIGYQVGGGGEMPLSQTWSMVLTLLFEGTILGGSTGGASNSSGLSVSATTAMLGIAIHP